MMGVVLRWEMVERWGVPPAEDNVELHVAGGADAEKPSAPCDQGDDGPSVGSIGCTVRSPVLVRWLRVESPSLSAARYGLLDPVLGAPRAPAGRAQQLEPAVLPVHRLVDESRSGITPPLPRPRAIRWTPTSNGGSVAESG